MAKKLNIRELLKDTKYDHLAEILAIKIEGWGLDNDRDIYSLSEHGKVAGINPNLIVEEIISQSLKDPEETQGVAVYETLEDIKDIDLGWLATPAALELAKENEINLSAVDGSGKDGAIVKKDVEKLINLEEDRHDD